MDYERLKDEMQCPHRSFEYLTWVHAKIERVAHESVGRWYVFDAHENVTCKKLVEEALPMALFARYYFPKEAGVYIKHCIDVENRQKDTESYDAEVVDAQGQLSFPIKFLEVTYPHDGKAEKLDETRPFHETVRLITKTIDNKMSIDYLPDTALVVFFDDTRYTNEDFLLFQSQMSVIKQETFCLIAFVGMSEQCFFVLD